MNFGSGEREKTEKGAFFFSLTAGEFLIHGRWLLTLWSKELASSSTSSSFSFFLFRIFFSYVFLVWSFTETVAACPAMRTESASIYRTWLDDSYLFKRREWRKREGEDQEGAVQKKRRGGEGLKSWILSFLLIYHIWFPFCFDHCVFSSFVSLFCPGVFDSKMLTVQYRYLSPF
jgi:hypothetical protein